MYKQEQGATLLAFCEEKGTATTKTAIFSYRLHGLFITIPRLPSKQTKDVQT